ncbi:hypothetical protein V6Z12_D03G058500 [Gossypium hirsutum]
MRSSFLFTMHIWLLYSQKNEKYKRNPSLFVVTICFLLLAHFFVVVCVTVARTAVRRSVAWRRACGRLLLRRWKLSITARVSGYVGPYECWARCSWARLVFG